MIKTILRRTFLNVPAAPPAGPKKGLLAIARRPISGPRGGARRYSKIHWKINVHGFKKKPTRAYTDPPEALKFVRPRLRCARRRGRTNFSEKPILTNTYPNEKTAHRDPFPNGEPPVLTRGADERYGFPADPALACGKCGRTNDMDFLPGLSMRIDYDFHFNVSMFHFNF